MLRPLQRRNMQQREMMGELSNLASDIVGGSAGAARDRRRAGLPRALRRASRSGSAGPVSRVARLQSVLDALQVLLPGIFVVIVVWLGARFAVQGLITPGELVAFYGYAAFLMMPLRTATEFANKAIRAVVVGAARDPRAGAGARDRGPRDRGGPARTGRRPASTSRPASGSAPGSPPRS